MRSYRSRCWHDAAGAVVFLFLLSAGAMRPSSGLADGALAIALPPDVVKGGFFYGYSRGYPDANQAEANALEKCRTTPDAMKDAKLRSLCKVIQDFSNQCVAVAMDPQAGTPGVGWAIAGDLHTAESQALTKCEQTAGPGRAAA
jgi:hypothetical protein